VELVKLPPLGLIVGVATVGKLTVRLNEVVRVSPPLIADTVMADVPAGVALPVLIVNVKEQVGLQLGAENEAVVPDGKPATE
jgi:hypothetical protein